MHKGEALTGSNHESISLLATLRSHPECARVANHSFFEKLRTGDIRREDVVDFLGQYWYPLNYFPRFLAHLIVNAPATRTRGLVSRILWQELGEGRHDRSHEELYISTMKDAGIERAEFVDVPLLASTKRLVDGYAAGGRDYRAGLGWLYGTETNDLTIVVGLGTAVTRFSGRNKLPWVAIHAKQEPGHVEDATATLGGSVTDADIDGIVDAARECWALWGAFFTELEARMVERGQASRSRS